MLPFSRSQGAPARLWLASADGAPREAEQPAPPSLADEQLLQALRSAQPSAAAALHDRARPIVDRTVARLLGRADMDREDMAQLALIELITSIDRFRGDCSLDAWISMISARVVYKHIRRRQTERKIFGAALSENAADASLPQPGGEALRSVIGRVQRHLTALDPSKAWTFLLHDVCGYDLREIAQITGASVAAAQTRLTRGRRELHERIGADPELRDWIAESGAGK